MENHFIPLNFNKILLNLDLSEVQATDLYAITSMVNKMSPEELSLFCEHLGTPMPAVTMFELLQMFEESPQKYILAQKEVADAGY